MERECQSPRREIGPRGSCVNGTVRRRALRAGRNVICLGRLAVSRGEGAAMKQQDAMVVDGRHADVVV